MVYVKLQHRGSEIRPCTWHNAKASSCQQRGYNPPKVLLDLICGVSHFVQGLNLLTPPQIQPCYTVSEVSTLWTVWSRACLPLNNNKVSAATQSRPLRRYSVAYYVALLFSSNLRGKRKKQLYTRQTVLVLQSYYGYCTCRHRHV